MLVHTEAGRIKYENWTRRKQKKINCKIESQKGQCCHIGQRETFASGEKKGNKVVWSRGESRPVPSCCISTGWLWKHRAVLSSGGMHSGFYYNSVFTQNLPKIPFWGETLQYFFFNGSNWLFGVALEESKDIFVRRMQGGGRRDIDYKIFLV